MASEYNYGKYNGGSYSYMTKYDDYTPTYKPSYGYDSYKPTYDSYKPTYDSYKPTYDSYKKPSYGYDDSYDTYKKPSYGYDDSYGYDKKPAYSAYDYKKPSYGYDDAYAKNKYIKTAKTITICNSNQYNLRTI